MEAIERFGQPKQPKRGPGQPKKKAADKVDLFIWEQFKQNNPEKKPLTYFVDEAIKTRQFPDARRNATPEAHVRRIRSVGQKVKIRAKTKDFDPNTASMEEYAAKRKAGWDG